MGNKKVQNDDLLFLKNAFTEYLISTMSLDIYLPPLISFSPVKFRNTSSNVDFFT